MLQVVPKDFTRRLLEWSDNGFPELDDRCGCGLDSATKAVTTHPQFSETPQQVNYVKEIKKIFQENCMYVVIMVILWWHNAHFSGSSSGSTK
jgi:hypothetical protein